VGVKKKTRRRLFGRSHDSAASRADSAAASRTTSASAASSAQASPVVKDSALDKDVKTFIRPKKTSEVKSGTERLSIFGATFPASLGKGRKPPPKYSA
jgi:hypothetical protein